MYKTKQIIKENLSTILFTSMIGLSAGMILNSLEEVLYAVPFLLTVIPALNDMIGDFSCIIASRTSTMFKLGNEKEIKSTFLRIFFVAIISSIYLLFVAWFLNPSIKLWKATILILGTATALIIFICILIYFLTILFLKQNRDPDNIIIPIATAIADVLSVLTLSILTRILVNP